MNVCAGWVDDSMCPRRLDEYWGENMSYGPQAFTTGRRGKLPPPPTRPKPKPGSQTLKVGCRIKYYN